MRINPDRRTVARKYNMPTDEVGPAELVAFTLGLHPDTLYSCDDDHVPLETLNRAGVTTDLMVWAGLRENTRNTIREIIRRKPITRSEVIALAVTFADEPTAVLCAFGIFTPPFLIWNEEQVKCLHLYARTSLATLDA